MTNSIDISFSSIFMMGYISCKVPEEVTKIIDNEVNRMIDSNFHNCSPYNNTLAGAIQHEYLLRDSVNAIDDLISVVAPTYWNNWGADQRSGKRHYIGKFNNSKDVWVNFQKKYEHNPLHTHGGELSFVIWHKIPYDIEEERKLPHLNKGNTNAAGVFYFNYPNFLSKGGCHQYNITVDKTLEHNMIIFPAFLQHGVFPFYTSDEYRISISGNIVYEQ